MTEIKTSRVPEILCWNCGKMISAATSWKDKRPRPGDVSVCIYCGEVGMFDAFLALRRPTDDEIVMMAGDKDLLLAQEIAGKLRNLK